MVNYFQMKKKKLSIRVILENYEDIIFAYLQNVAYEITRWDFTLSQSVLFLSQFSICR